MRQLQWSDEFPASGGIAVARHTVNGEVTAHGHDFLELAFVLGGRGTHRSFAGDAPLEKDSLIVVRPHAWHAYLDATDLEVVNVCFPVSLLSRELAPVESSLGLRRLLRDAPLDPARRGVLLVKAEAPPVLQALQSTMRPMIRTASLLTLLDALEATGERLASSAVPEPVARVLAAMEADLSQEWNRRRFTEIAGVGEAHLARLFGRAVGVAPMNYLRRLRLTEASSRLRSTTLPVGEIAAAVGYLDANLFARRFKQAFGTTPSESRGSKAA